MGTITRRAAMARGTAAMAPAGAARARDVAMSFDAPGDMEIALVRCLSAGDVSAADPAGVKAQAKALRIGSRVPAPRQDAAPRVDIFDHAIALGVAGIPIRHGLTQAMQAAAQRAVDAGIPVLPFGVDAGNDGIPQIERSDYPSGRLEL